MLTCMTYNILYGGYQREHLISAIVESVQPDIVLLQELHNPDTLTEFAAGLNAHSFYAPSNTGHHLGIISRYPFVEVTSFRPFPPIRTAILAATIALPRQHLQIFGVHLVPHPALLLELWRWWEVRTLLKHTRPYQAAPCLIAGDFNAIAPGDRLVWAALPPWLKWMLLSQGRRVFHYALTALLAAGFTDCYRSLHPHTPGFTLPSSAPNARLDYMFANPVLVPALKTCSVVTTPASVREASDHLPLVAQFDLEGSNF